MIKAIDTFFSFRTTGHRTLLPKPMAVSLKLKVNLKQGEGYG